MIERDELAEIIQDCGEYIPGSHADDYVSPTKAASAIIAAGWRSGAEVTSAEKAMQDVDAALERYISGELADTRALMDIARIVGAYSVERIGEGK